MTDLHNLTRDQFDALAGGGGGAAEIAVLRAGQASKHLVMILTILDTMPRPDPTLRTLVDRACDLLAAAQRAAPEAVARVLAHPHVGLWTSRCLRQLTGNTTYQTQPIEVEIGHLGAVAATAGWVADLEFEVAVALREGTVMLPTVGVARIDAPAGSTATVVHRAGRLHVRCGARVVDVPAEPARDAPGWYGQRMLVSEVDGLAAAIELVDLGPGRDGRDRTTSTRLDDAVVARWRAVFDGAWAVLVRDHPDLAPGLAAGLVGVLPLGAKSEDAVFSATMRDAFGYFESELTDDPVAFAETLVHEFQHSKLYGVIDLFPLSEHDTAQIYFAPWRQDPRPLPGLLQGTYAFLGVTSFWRVRQRMLTGARRDRAYFEFARWRHQVSAAADELLASGWLTDAGVELVERMRETARSWQDEPVPADLQRLADYSTLEHRVTWRMANVQPNPESIARLVESWSEGRPATVDAVTVARTVRSDGVVRRADRLLLTQLRLDDPVAFEALCSDAGRRETVYPEIGPADLAYLRDDFGTAAELYVAEIADSPDRLGLWAGLATALRVTGGPASGVLSETPEVVYAMYHLIVDRTGAAPDLLSIANWLAAEPTDRQSTTTTGAGRTFDSGADSGAVH